MTTKKEKVLEALQDGQELTAAQIGARWGVGNPRAPVSSLRMDGYAVYANKRVDSHGRESMKYRIGTPSREVVAAGYAALA